jgi:RsiW-degrading membrane proteinase PrsW (M82 family)
MESSRDRPAAVDLPRWWSVLSAGLALWVASVLVTALTGNLNMIPTVVLLGSFLVPVTVIVWYLDHYQSKIVTPRVIFSTFIVGGVLGVLAASLLESWLVSDSPVLYAAVGLIEELAKLMALLFVARRLPHYVTRDGIVLGAAVGFGFGALESSGYALNALFVAYGHHVALSLGSLVYTEFLRGILAPVGHGLWTAILGGVVFSAARGGRLRLTGKVAGAYLLVALLHTLWDAMRGIAVVVTAILTATPFQRMAASEGIPVAPTSAQLRTFLLFEFGGFALISIIGLVILWSMWQRAARSGDEEAA